MPPHAFSEAPAAGVDRRVRRFRLAGEVDTFAVTTARLLVVVDTMSTPADARLLRDAVARDRPGRRLVVVDTHADYDHAWGNQEFTRDAVIVGHERCAERLAGAAFADDLDRWRRRMPGRFDEVVGTPPAIRCGDDGLVLDGGDLTLHLVHTPGHSDDHLSLHVPELGLVLAGDAAEDPFPHVDSPAGLRLARRSLERLAALGPRLVLPCHGGGTDAAIITRNLAWLDAIEADPELPYEEALRRFSGIGTAVDEMYRSFHADACAAVRGA